MRTQKPQNLPIYSMSLDDVATSTGIGRSNVFAASKSGELETFRPVINGKPIKRRLSTTGAVKRWVDYLRTQSGVQS